MAFDIQAAKKEGYSDTEIADYLASKRKFDLAGAREEGYSDTEIVKHLQPKRPFLHKVLHKAVDLLTAGHAYGEYGPEQPEVSFDASGKMTNRIANVPTGDPGFFQDPVTFGAMAAVQGARVAGQAVAPMATRLSRGALAAGREGLGWLTGGGSEVPQLVKAGAKGVARVAEIPNLAKTATERAGKPFAEVPVKMGAETVQPATRVATEATPRVVEPLPEANVVPPELGGRVPDSLIPEIKGGVTGELPKYAEGSAINLERLNTTEDVSQFINQRAKAASQKIGKRKVSWEETRAHAEALGWDEKAIKREWDKTGGISAAKIDATRQININEISELHKMIRELPDDRTMLTPEIRAKYMDVMDTIRVTSQMASEAGRSLNIHKRVLQNDPAFKATSEFNRVLNRIAGKGIKRTDDLIMQLKDLDFNDPAAINRFVYDVTKSNWEKLSDGAFELWINGLLSSPLTHIVNTTSNALTLAYTYPERLLATGIEAARAKVTRTPREMFFGETAQDIFSVSKGLQDAWRRFGTAMRKGDMANKLDYRPTAFPEDVAKLMPTRALIAEDAFFKGFIENAELNRLAYRQAFKEGLKGKALQDKIVDLLAHPTESMLEAVVKRGKYLTYQKELGAAGSLIFRARETVPGLKYFVPFVKTPANIAKFALERSPLYLPIAVSKALKGQLKGAALSEQLAKPLMGTMLATTIYQLAEQGYVTGGLPKKAGERNEKLSTGWQPYSIKIGDTYHSFGRLEPLGSILGMAADMSQIKKEMNENDKFNLAAGIMGSITENISNKTFMQGFTNLIQGISDPGRYGANMVRKLAGSAIPSVSGAINRSIDPNVRDIRGIGDTLQSRIVGASESLPSKLTVWGEPIERPGSAVGRFLSPMQMSKEKGSPVERELLRLDLDIGYPSRKIGNVELNPDEYWGMVQAGSKPAKVLLDALVQSSTWKAKSAYQKERAINSLVDRFRKSAHEKMIVKLIKDGRLRPSNEKEAAYLANQFGIKANRR